MYSNDPMRVLTGEVRLSFCNLVEPKAPKMGGDPKYSVTMLIPKSDTATKDDIAKTIQFAYEEGVKKKWNGARPQLLHSLIHDGDGVKPSDGTPYGDECKGHWVLTASSKDKPQVVGISNINCDLAPSDIYGGMFARVMLRFYCYDNGSKGVGCGLGNVLKTRDGEPLSGRTSAASDFAGLEQPAASAPIDYNSMF